MTLWEIFVVAGLAFVILEMLVPSMFFLNLALAGFVTAIISLFISNWVTLTLIFVVLSLLRPILLRTKETKEQQTGMEGKYIGKIVKVIEPVDRFHGAITVYDERWDARCDCEEPIPAGTEVKIIKYDSLVLTVEKI